MRNSKLMLLTACAIPVFVWSVGALAEEYELTPNPNPGNNSITIASGDIANNNAEPFENFGAIVVQDGGSLRNIAEMDILFDEDFGGGGLSTVTVELGGVLETLVGSKMNFDSISHFNVSGTVNNLGDISSDWSMQLAVGSQFNNSGTVNNKQGATNRGTFVNAGSFLNSTPANETGGFFQQIGDFQNQVAATMLNHGELLNFTTITNHGSITNHVFLSGGIGRGIFRNMGTLNNESDGTVTNRHRWFNTGTLNNSGLFVNHQGGLGMSNEAGAAIHNLPGGTFQNDSVMNGSGQITNAGVFHAGNIAGASSFQQTGGETVVEAMLDASTIEFMAGIVRGTGTLSGSVSVAAPATISPGRSVGQLSISGSLELDGNYRAELGALSSADSMDVTGDVIVGPNSVLELSFISGFEPQPGDAFDLLFAEQINAPIANVIPPMGFETPFLVQVLADEFGSRDVMRLSFLADVDCDFDGDGTCGLQDLNALLGVGPIANGVPASVAPQLDLTGDGVIDLSDRDVWLDRAAISNGLQLPYKTGDANLDGFVDGLDFIQWNSNRFTSSLFWDAGNFNGDAFVDGTDFIAWNLNKFTSSHLLLVPEPNAAWQLVVALIWCVLLATRRSEIL
jgi:hypothetical protein